MLVDFFAEWCGPCKAMAPALEQVAAEMKGKVKVAKLDVDANPGITQKYHIQAMPTLMIFKDGKVAAQRVGALVQKKQLARTGSTARSEPRVIARICEASGAIPRPFCFARSATLEFACLLGYIPSRV